MPSYCEECGEKVYANGCTNCQEENYIEEQRWENERDKRDVSEPTKK